jgi:hypothetical protein
VKESLNDLFEAYNVPKSNRPDLAAEIRGLVVARIMAELTSRTARAPIKPPLPELTAMQIQVAKNGLGAVAQAITATR